MAKKVDNTYVPKFVSNNIPWYERDGLNTWYEQMKCNEFLEDTDNHFKNLEITNFDMIYNKKTLSNDKIKQYQSIDHHEIMKYAIKERDQIMLSIFRNSKLEDMYVQTKTINEHFKNNSKSIGRGRFVEKLKNEHYKEIW